ncbi:basic leucine zipper 34-like [Ricinus communis]|uniref:basic leucine zipper 34-like n=1 Tax=Ricinus communis TaxID=3988 RepID=UPI0007725DD0|nr:basic leucine zipper 34-like [Ricinus communis]|eukprot:XP_015573027.1 basic leucine zipper 34-like [Ricinus communis]
MENVNKEFPSVENAQMTGHKDSQGRPLDSNMAQKKLRRLMASREYSQKYRMKQLHYILQLETEVKALQAEVSIISPRIKYVDRQNSLLRVENGSIKHRLSTFSSDLMIKEAQYGELKKERDILKQFYVVNQQQFPEYFNAIPTTTGNFLQFGSLLRF